MRAPIVTLRLTSLPSSRTTKEVGPGRCTRNSCVSCSSASRSHTACGARRGSAGQ